MLGAICGVKVAALFPKISGFHAICAGIGGFFGYLALALVMWLLDQYGVSVLNEGSLIFLWVATLVALTNTFMTHSFVQFSSDIKPMHLALSGIFLIYTAFWFYMLANLPVLGWDVVDHWGLVAKLFVEHSTGGDTAPFYYHFYHPKTLSFILGWSSWVAYHYGSEVHFLWATPSVGYGLSFLLIVGGFAFNQTRDHRASIAICLLASTIPLVENHILIAGYAEIPLGLVMVAATVTAVIAINERSLTLIMASVVLPIISIFLKGAGPVYLLAPLLALLAVWLMRIKFREQLAFFGSCLAGAIYIAREGCILQISGHALGYDAELGAFLLPGRQPMELFFPSVSDLLSNLFHSRILKSSFSLSSLIGILAFIEVIRTRKNKSAPTLQIIFFTFCLLLVEQLISQFTYYGFRFATPDNDTGFSRFSLPAFMLIPVLVASLINPERLAETASFETPETDPERLH